MTIKEALNEAKADRRALEESITQAIGTFEKKYGIGTFHGVTFKRWNGSNAAFGNIVSVRADIRILDETEPPLE